MKGEFKMSAINENDLMNNQLYQIILATGEDFKVFAYDEQEAIDILADHLVEEEREYSYADHYEIADLCEVGQSVDEYVEENGYYHAGEHGVYIQVTEIKTISIEEEF